MYSIGKFSEICNVPVKTIRYYSDLGLLEPSYIDPVTKYRYYDYDKIQTMEKIVLLKNCQFPLYSIKEMIENDYYTQWRPLLDQKIAELEIQKEQISELIKEMNDLKTKLEKKDSIITEPLLSKCFVENRKKITVFSIRSQIKVKFIDLLVKKLFDRVYAYNLEINGKLMAVFHERNINKNEADVELLLPVKTTNQKDGCRIMPGGLYACLTMQGPYSGLEMGYKALEEWVMEQNLKPLMKPFEIYEQGLIPSDFNVRDVKPNLNIPPSEFITKICVQVNKV